MIDVSSEIKFKTARSGGKGGQNVNKVETMVEGNFHVADSLLLTDEQKERLGRKLKNKINAEGFLQVKSQVHRSQLANKQEVTEKINNLIALALHKEKKTDPYQAGQKGKGKTAGVKKERRGHQGKSEKNPVY